MRNYNLGFIGDKDIFSHVQTTVLKYRFKIDLADFNSNLIDPIKFTFDSKVYERPYEDVLKDEIIRQIDKSNGMQIGYFHQNIFKYIGKDWIVPDTGYDVVNNKQKIYVEMKNKHNTMNSSSSQKTYMRMQKTIIDNPSAKCLLVEVIAKNSQDVEWVMSLDGSRVCDKRIRRVSIDKFYEIVTGDRFAFCKLCEKLPLIIDDVLSSIRLAKESNTVVMELKRISPNILKSIYMLSFAKYEGFQRFNIS